MTKVWLWSSSAGRMNNETNNQLWMLSFRPKNSLFGCHVQGRGRETYRYIMISHDIGYIGLDNIYGDGLKHVKPMKLAYFGEYTSSIQLWLRVHSSLLVSGSIDDLSLLVLWLRTAARIHGLFTSLDSPLINHQHLEVYTIKTSQNGFRLYDL